MPGTGTCICNLSVWEVEAGGLPRIKGQLVFLSHKKGREKRIGEKYITNQGELKLCWRDFPNPPGDFMSLGKKVDLPVSGSPLWSGWMLNAAARKLSREDACEGIWTGAWSLRGT